MHAPSAYERYLLRESRRYGWGRNEDNDFPAWLVLEKEAYDWIFDLSRRICDPLYNKTVSKQMLERVAIIPTIRFLRYRDISPSLKEAFHEMALEFSSLDEDLKRQEMWKRPQLLSNMGMDRWEKAVETVSKCRNTKPDPEWRERWEKERVAPYCTRREAECIALRYLQETEMIDLLEIDQEGGEHKYWYWNKAKDGLFRIEYGLRGTFDNPFIKQGVVEVDMLTRKAKASRTAL